VARYVLVEFNDDKAADAFVMEVTIESMQQAEPRMRVRAMYQKPTKFHDPATCHRSKMSGWTRGKKYGWWVCALCKKPTKAWGDGEHWFAAIGVNLLPKDIVAPEYRGDGDYSSPLLEQAKEAYRGAEQAQV
jgi:hypothetical protein